MRIKPDDGMKWRRGFAWFPVQVTQAGEHVWLESYEWRQPKGICAEERRAIGSDDICVIGLGLP